jgi:hypothetical protein
MVWLLHSMEIRRVFGLLFPYQRQFIKLKILARPKRKLVFCPPSYSKRSLFEGMIPRKLKEHLKWVGFVWSYAHEYLFLGELSQEQVLLMSKIPTPDQMIQIDKKVKIQNSKMEKNKDTMEWNIPSTVEDCEEGSSSLYMSIYNLDCDEEYSYFPSK